MLMGVESDGFPKIFATHEAPKDGADILCSGELVTLQKEGRQGPQ